MFSLRRQSQTVTGDDLSRNIFKPNCSESSHGSKKSPFTPNHPSQGWVVDSLLVFHSDFTFMPEGLLLPTLWFLPDISV